MTNVDLEPNSLAPIDSYFLFDFLNRRISFLDLQWKSFFLRWLEKSDGKKDCNGKREIAPKKRFRGNCFEFEILRNKKPENLATSGFDISIYCYSMSVPNHEASPLQKAILLMYVD
ncbi:hypothetical protein [Kaistella faecalis]|uniref:hypothetical protein n=1 Tax=Kaistella faecalis TaxID=2852098 RepID=UPI001C44E084|nr:hypothetical protein [Chryseobacterium faecale]UFK96792.1 hypothetical protein LL667_07360 [Chryseobacterium faecale]